MLSFHIKFNFVVREINSSVAERTAVAQFHAILAACLMDPVSSDDEELFI